MSIYYDEIAKPEVKEYFRVLESEFPEWLFEYIDTPRMLAQARISMTCGVIYSDLFPTDMFYSSLDHSVGVALIVWHFTRDKRQTLAGLFHDIATPAFKHCVDFLNGDYLKQESTEDLTSEFISGSAEIMELLERDGILVSEVDNYHIYPIADNDTPRLSADRLEYSLSNPLFTYKAVDLVEIREIYEDLRILKNEEGEVELGFRTKKLARKFVKLTSRMSVIYRDDRTRYSMSLIADILRGMSKAGEITVEDLYRMRESEVIDLISRSKYGEVFEGWRKAKSISASETRPQAICGLEDFVDGVEGVYAVNQASKVRYIDPLVLGGAVGSDSDFDSRGERISSVCKIAAGEIEKNLGYGMDRWVWMELFS
ncbi:MAG: hypothetical protein Q4B65_01265 [Candidatus Saccharibacteria bacterium]|nr:hypothetical protein [Candidatus Saccharibacteria bacterium]